MDLGIRDRVAIVAAASRGLGKASAMALATEGAQLAICSRNAQMLESAAAEISGKCGREVFHRAVDVTDPEQVRAFVAAVADRYGRIDICVTNAGGPPAKTFLNISREEWHAAVQLNLMSTVHMAREVIPWMQRQKWGRLVTITSVSVKQPMENLLLSNSVRAAVTGLAKTLSNEFGKDNITVNNVCPGYTLTDRLEELAGVQALAQGIAKQAVYENWSKDVPMQRIGKPEEFAAVVAFLCSERASYVTGVSIQVDGGRYKGLL